MGAFSLIVVINLLNRKKMGKRSTTSTKGGKFMNPTDQARKEARRKELKKNKKTRMAVRASVLKNKNVEQILNDLRDLDRQEYDPEPEDLKGPLGAQDKVIKEKRRKLVETLDRVLKLYARDDPDRATDVKSMINEYEQEKRELAHHFEAIRQTRFVNLDEIPLPPSMNFSDIPMPTDDPSVVASQMPAVKQLTAQLSAVIANTGKAPPGPPPGKPPLKKFKQYYASSKPVEEENSLMSGSLGIPGNLPSNLNPVQARLMSLAGQPIPGQPMRPGRAEEPLPPGVAHLPPPIIPPPQGIPLPPGAQNPGVNRPPRPDVNIPGSVFSAPPSIIEKTPAITIKHTPTIQAKPQMNPALKAASTKFVPTALKVKREGTGHKVRSANEIAEAAMAASKSSSKDSTGETTAPSTASKDEIYQQFLAEVSELL